MAHPKKGALHQVLVPMVDATDFASVESAITASDFNSGATLKWYGVNTGGSAATTSGTVSKTASLVRSGVFRITLKTTENNYDLMMLRISKTGCAEQIITWSNVDNDDSDIMSALTVIQSMASDAASAAQQGSSRILVNTSMTSDIASYLVAMSGMLSDVQSAVIVTQSAASDTLSRCVVIASMASDAASAAQQANSRILVNTSLCSDIYSQLSDFRSDLGSLVTATGVQLNASTLSDIRSAIAGVTATLSASDVSDIASAVRAILASDLSDIHSAATLAGSRVLVVQSMVSDTHSKLSDVESNLLSLLTTTGVALNASSLSDIRSALAAGVALDASTMSDIRSAVNAVTVNLTASDISDIASAVAAAVTTINASDISDIASAVRAILASDLSDILSAAQQGNSRVLVVQSLASDAHSAAVVAQLDASDLSDIASAVWGAKYTAHSAASSFGSLFSDVSSRVVLVQSAASDAHSAAVVASSRALLNQSRISDVYSLLSGLESEFGSRVPANFSDMLSDIQVSADAAASRAQLIRSSVSDVQSQIAAGVEIGASSLSDLRSVVAAHGVQRAGADITAVPAVTATMADKVDWMFALSRNRVDQTATQQKLYNDAASQIASAAVSDDGTTFQRSEWAG